MALDYGKAETTAINVMNSLGAALDTKYHFNLAAKYFSVFHSIVTEEQTFLIFYDKISSPRAVKLSDGSASIVKRSTAATKVSTRSEASEALAMLRRGTRV